MDEGWNSSGQIATRRKRKIDGDSKNTNEPVGKADLRLETVCDDLFNIVNDDSLLTNPPDPDKLIDKLEQYRGKLSFLVLSGCDNSSIRRKIYYYCLDFLDNGVSNTELLLYTLRTYSTFLKCLLNDTTEESLTHLRRNAIDQMLDLIETNISGVEEEEEGFLRQNNSPQPVYNSPEQLACKLRLYANFLKWLHEETNQSDNNYSNSCYDPHKRRGKFIADILKALGEDYDKMTAQRVAYIVHDDVFLFKNHDNRDAGTMSNQEPAEKKQTSVPNPIMDGLSEDDRKLLNRFLRRDRGIALHVFPELHEYKRQVKESEGFDFDTYPGSFDHMTPIHPVGLFSSDLKNIDYQYLAELAIAKYAKHKIKFKEAVRVNVRRHWRTRHYYLTFLGYYGKSLNRYRTLVFATLSNVTDEEDYKVLSFRTELIENLKTKRVTRASAKLTAQNLESEVKVDKYIAHVLESKGTSENESTCEKHMEELALYKTFMDMPDCMLLQKFREAYRSTAQPLITEIRQYFEQVSKSEGFHIGKYPGFFPGVTSIIKPYKWSLWALGCSLHEKFAELAIQVYNDENVSQFVFKSIKEVNVSEGFHYHLYITFFAHTGDNIDETFQALVLVNMFLLGNYKVHFVRKATN